MRATLEEVMTDEAYSHMESLAAGWRMAFRRDREASPAWHVARVGARVEFICAPGPLRNGGEAVAAHQPALEAAIHLALVNRSVLIAPFHNMMLVSPATTARHVARLVGAFDAICGELSQ